MTAGLLDGRLVFTWHYAAGVHREETVRALVEEYTAQLAAFVAHCAEPGAAAARPRTSPWSPSTRKRWTGSPGTAARSRTSTR
ncbi:hypothetical protein ACFQVA_17375 [Actinomadura keratinilytica]